MFVTNLRQSGIDTLGDVPWGTHFCHFYKTREDLLSILVPYFKAGLANNEFCMWVTAEFLSAQEATQAMTEAVPDFASYVSRGQMEIVPHNQWYRKNGAPSLQKALDGWIEKLNEALARGYEGMRVSGDTIWLRKKDWKKFTDYEETVNGVMGNHRMIALCTYSLERCNTDAVFDVMGNHGVALIRNEGEWEVIETSASTKTREALREREERLRAVFNASTAMILLLDRHGTVLEANEAQGQVMGLEREAVVGKNIWDLFGPDIAQGRRAQVEKVLQTGEPLRVEDEGQNGRWYGASIYPVRDAQGVITGVAVYSRDITETKRADDTVRGREELYRHLLGSTTDGIFALDGGWRYVLFNEAYTRIVGLPKETLTGARITDLFPGIEETEFFEAFERVIKMGVSETVNGEFTFPDGRTGWYDVSVDPVPEGILCIARDITEQKRVLDSLSASEEKHRLLVENAHEAIAVIQIEDTRMLFANRRAEEMSGYSAEKLMSCSMLEFIHPDDRDMMADRHLRRLRGEDVTPQHEFRYIDRWGNTKWVTMNTAELDWQGRPAVLVFLNDVTERRQADEELRRSEENYRRIVETANEGICAFDADLRMTFANQKMADMVGYSVEELIGKDARALLMFEEDLPEVERRLASRRRGEPGRYEQRFRRKDGSDCWVVVSATPVTGAEGGFSGSIAMFTDINDRKKSEDELRRSEERYRRLVEDLPESFVVYSYGVDGTVHYVSPGAEKVFGVPVTEGLRSDWMQLLDWDREDLAAGWENIENLLSGREFRRTVELSFTRPDGQRRTVLVRPRPKRDGDGAIVGVEGIVEDITERKRAELALAADNERREVLLGLQRMMDASEKEIVEYVVEGSVKASRSDYAFVGLLDDTESVMSISAWSREAMAQGAMEEMPTEYPVAGAGIWTECVRQRRPVIVNDFETPDPRAKGYPGHVRVTRFMGVPVFEGERIRAVVAVANGESPYDEPATEGLRTVADRMWGMIRRSRSERALRLENKRSGVLLRLQTLMDSSEKEILDAVLDGSLKSTESEFAFIGLMDETESVMTIHNWSRETMEQCRTEDKPIHFPIADAGIWADCVRQRRPVLINDYEAPNPGKKGYPPGHVAIKRFLGMPVLDGDRIVAVVAVANKQTDYDDSDANALSVLTYRMWAIIRRRRAEQALRLENERRGVLLGLQRLMDASEKEIFDYVVEGAVKSTQSEISFITLMDETESVMTIHGWSRGAMEQCSIEDKPMHYPVGEAGIWAECVRQRRPVFVNDYEAENPAKKGYPPGHAAVGRFLSAPVFDGDRIVAVISVANKQTDYDESDANALVVLTYRMWAIVRRKRAEEEVRASLERYRSLYESIAGGVLVRDRDGVITEANVMASEILGLTRDEITGRTSADPRWRAIHEDGSDFVAEDHPSMVTLRTGQAVRNVVMGVHNLAENEQRWILVNSEPIRDTSSGETQAAVATFLDITDRRKMIEDLRLSEERYRLVVENTHEAVVVIRDGEIVFANSRAEDLTGYPADELVSRSMLDFIHPGDQQKVADRYVRRMRGEAVPSAYEIRLTDRWGEMRQVELNVAPTQWNGEGPVLIAFLNDVTERKKAEDELKASEERYRLVVENAHEAILVIDGDRIVFANAKAEEVSGYNPEDLASKPILEFVHPGDLELVADLFARRPMEADRKFSYAFRFVDKWGNTRWVETNSALAELGGKQVILAFASDVTDRKAAEDKLKASEERYRLVVENAHEAIMVVQDGRIVFANSGAQEMSGYTMEDFASMSILDYVHPDDRELAGVLYERRIKGETAPTVFSFRYLDKWGNARWAEANAAVFDWHGRPAIAAFLNDVTERRKAEDEVRATGERYRLVVENTYDAIAIIQEDRIVFANRKGEELAGYLREDLLSMALTDFIHPDDQESVLDIYERTMRGADVPDTIEFRFVDREGTIKLVEVNGVLFEWEGRPALLAFISDITERRRAVNELMASEERYRLVVENTYDAIVVIHDGRIVFANRKAEELTGYPREVLFQKSMTDFVYPDDVKRVIGDYEEALKGQAMLSSYEFRFVNREGSIRLVQVNGALFDWKGNPALLGFISDITERRKAEDDLKASEEKYRRIVETANEGIIVTDEEGRLTFANSRAAQIFGYSLAEMLGKSYVDFVPRKDIGRYRAAWKRHKKGASEQYETCLARKDGSTLWTMVSAAPLFEGKRYSGTLAMLSDITGLKETEKRLRESQKHLRTISESSLVGITVCDLKGRIWDANDAFLGITGHTREEVKKGKLNWLKMTPADYEDANEHAITEMLEKGYAAPFEKEYLRKDGSRVAVMVGGALMGADGGVPRMVCVVLDITRVKMAEEALARDRNMLRAIMENTEAQLAYLDRDYRFLAVNSAYTRGSRQSAKRLIGRSHFALFPDPENQAIFERVRDTGEGVRFHDKAFVFADQPERGTTYWDWSLVPVKDSSGRVDGLVLSLVDTTERVRIEDELMKHRERLESLVELRTRKLTRSYDMLRKEIAERKKIEEELRGLSNRLVEMQEEERKSLARELHDEIGQSLTIVKLFLDRCHAHLQDETFRRDSVEVRAMVKKLMEQVRSLSLDLRPMMLDDLGLMSALQWHFNRFTDQSHVQVNFKQSGLEKKRIPPEVGTAAYRIVQEALTNVARYANVAEAMVSIEAKKGLLRIEVEDHGAGFDMERAAEGPGAGLSGIRERVIALNGTLTIESAEGAGTYVLAELPLPDGAGRKASKAAK